MIPQLSCHVVDSIDSDSDSDTLRSPKDLEPEKEALPQAATLSDEPPDGGYGWVCVVGMLLITAMTLGINGSYGVYLAFYTSNSIFPSATETDFAWIGGLSVSQITFIAPLVTKYARHLGTTTTLLTGTVIEAGALISASFTTRVWQLYLTQGLLFGWGSCFLFVGATGIIPQWFSSRRSFANSVASAGSGLGGLIWCLACGKMITSLGVPWSLRITAAVSFTINGICSLLMRDRNTAILPDQRAFDLRLLRRYQFNLLVLWGLFSMFAYTILLFTLPTQALTLGFTSSRAALIAAMVNLGMAVGRPTIGFLSDRVGRINMALLATVIGSLSSFLIWIFARSLAALVVFALVAGSVCGTFWATIGVLVTEVLGVKRLPSALSILWTTAAVPCLVATPIATQMAGPSGAHADAGSTGRTSFVGVQLFTGSMFLAGSVCMLMLREWKIRDNTTHPDPRVQQTEPADPVDVDPRIITDPNNGNGNGNGNGGRVWISGTSLYVALLRSVRWVKV